MDKEKNKNTFFLMETVNPYEKETTACLLGRNKNKFICFVQWKQNYHLKEVEPASKIKHAPIINKPCNVTCDRHQKALRKRNYAPKTFSNKSLHVDPIHAPTKTC